jgi:hypothetical protein
LDFQCATDVPPPIANLSATDICSGQIIVPFPVEQVIPGSCPNDFSVIRTWVFVDECGNNATVSRTIVVDDTILPVFNPPPPDFAQSICYPFPPPNNLLWTDNCDGNGTIVGVDSTIPDPCSGGIIQRTWSFTDSCGNVAIPQQQTLTLSQRPNPVITCPPHVEVFCGNDTSSASTGVAVATDSCNATLSVTIVESDVGSAICNTFILRTWTVTDICNRTDTCGQVISNVPVSPDPLPTFIEPDTCRIVAWVLGILLALCIVILVITCIWGCRNGTLDVENRRRRSVNSNISKKSLLKGQ